MTAILVTGGNAGIGYELCKHLLINTDYDIIMGSRSKFKGEEAVNRLIKLEGSIDESSPSKKIQHSRRRKNRILKCVQLDVTDSISVASAVESLKHITFYALVNNAGTGFAHDGINPQIIMETNLFGVKRVTESFLPLLSRSENGSRIIMVSSGAAPTYITSHYNKNSDSESPGQILSSYESTWEQLEDLVSAFFLEIENNCEYRNYGNKMRERNEEAYNLSKACVTNYAMQLARLLPPEIRVNSCNPGFIQTNMSRGYGAEKKPDAAIKVFWHLLFENLGSENGCFYDCDGQKCSLIGESTFAKKKISFEKL